ncbi:hypothetical protein A4X13_0g3760 [Tilletia indica]|uniref:Uncharacterized protein n=1 Tax=Tilletia indica TaxID=43049 RepID=A0A177TQ32_9BASI|nr:hypothetical protein A4X13_0g3760 [Tilletia indica]
MTKAGSARGLRSLFTRRQRSSQENPALTPLTIYQASVGSTETHHEPPYPAPAHKVYPSSPEDVEHILATGSTFEEPPTYQHPASPQEDESLEMLEDGSDYDDMSPSNSSGDCGGNRPSRRSRAYSRPQAPSISHNPTQQPLSGKRDRRDSVGGASISSVRSWRDLFRLSQTFSNDRGAKENQEIRRAGSVASIRSLAISSPVAIQASTSSVVEIGAIPRHSQPLRARASSPAMSSQARFEPMPPVPLRNALEPDDDQVRRQLLHSAVSHASHSPSIKNRSAHDSGREHGLRKRSSSIASLSSLLGAAIGLGSRTRERANSGVGQPISAPGIALSNSTNSFTILSAPQGPPPLTPSKKRSLKPITVQPAAPAVSGSTSGADLGCAPKHSLASSADVDGKSSKRWKFRSRRKTAEVTAQTLRAMTQSRAVESDEHRVRPEASSASLASSSALGGTMSSQFNSNSSERIGLSPSPVSQPYEEEGAQSSSTGLLVNMGRWANQMSGRTRLSSTNSALSYTSDARSTPSSVGGYPISQDSGRGHQLLRHPGNNFDRASDGSEMASTGTPSSHAASSPGSLNHWLTDLDLNLPGTHGLAHGGKQAHDKRMFGDLPNPRAHQAPDDILSVQSNNGSMESVVFLIKPTAEPMAPDVEANGGPRPQLSRRSTRESARNSMKALTNEHRPLSTCLSEQNGRVPTTLLERSETVKQDLHTAGTTTTEEPTAVPQQCQTPTRNPPPLPVRSSSRTQLPTRSSAVSELCSIKSDVVSGSYDDETEVVAQRDSTDSAQRGCSEADSAVENQDQQGMESQQVDPWGSYDANLGLVAESDSAAAVLASMVDSGSTEAVHHTPSRRRVVPSSPLRGLPKKDSEPTLRAEDQLSADYSAADATSMQTSGQDELCVAEASVDISATSCDVVVAQKIIIEAVALNTLPAALSPTPAERFIQPRAETAIPTHVTATGLAILSNQLVGATVEQAVEVTASLANLGSMSMISNASLMLVMRNSLEAPEPLTPSEPMTTPSLRSDSFSTEGSSDSLCSLSHRADYGGQAPGSVGDITSTPFRSTRALVKEEDHFDQWGSTPNGLMLDLSTNGNKPASQHFEDAVRSFQDRQRQHSRTQTGGTEGWGKLSPLLGTNSVLSLPVSTMVVAIDAAEELSPVKPSRSRPLAPSTSILNPANGTSSTSIGRKLAFALPRHKSGNALGENKVQVSMTMPEILQQKVELEGKRASVPNGLVSLNEFLTELKGPVNVNCPPPPMLQTRRHARSKTSDGATEHRAKRTRAQTSHGKENHAEQESSGLSSRRRVRTTSASNVLRSSRPTNTFYPSLDGVKDTSALAEEEEGNDSSLIREDWQRFALGRIGASLLNVDLDPDASHRAVHTHSPRQSPGKAAAIAAARVSRAINKGRRSDGSDRILSLLEDYEDERDQSSGVDSLRPDEAPRSSTPSPMKEIGSASASPAKRLLPAVSALRTEIQIDSNEMADVSGGLSEAHSTAMARCHTPLEEESAFDVLQLIHKDAISSGSSKLEPSVGMDKALFSGDKLKLLACLMMANSQQNDNVADSTSTSISIPIPSAGETSLSAAVGASPNTSTADASTSSSSSAAYFSADLSSETEGSTIDIVEHLLRKAMWARYEKEVAAVLARREQEVSAAGAGELGMGATKAEKETPSIPRLAVTDVDEDLELD